MKFITGLSQYEPRGPITIDFVHLWDGRVLGINNECVVLYKDMDDFENAEGNHRQMIDLTKGESVHDGFEDRPSATFMSASESAIDEQAEMYDNHDDY